MTPLFKTIPAKITFILTLLIVISATCFAQPAGLQGKRFIIGLEVATGPSFTFLNDYRYLDYYNSTGNTVWQEEPSPFGFVIKPTLYLEYILTRKSSLQVLGRYFTRKVDVESYAGPTSQNSTLVTYHPTERTKATFISGGLRYKFYVNDALAPIGTYQTVALEYNLMHYAI